MVFFPALFILVSLRFEKGSRVLGCHIFITDPDDVCGVEEDNGVLLSRTWMACGKERKTMVSRPTNKAKDPRVGAGGRE